MTRPQESLREALRLADELGVDLTQDHRGIPYDVIERVDAIVAALRAVPEPPREDEVERLRRIETAARALFVGSGDEELPDEEWDPLFLDLREALR